MKRGVCLGRTAVLAVTIGVGAAFAGSPVGAAFTYQGQLKQGGVPYSGSADFEFVLFDAASEGNLIGSAVNLSGVEVVNGLFNVELDFGAEAFDGEERWLEISVDGTPLAPRQAITATPYALAVRPPLSLSSSSAPVVEAATDSTTFDSAAIRGTHSGAAGSPTGVQGEVTQSLLGSAGVTGLATAVTGNAWGMLANASSPEGTGLSAAVGNTLYYRPGAGVVGAGPDTGVLGYTPTTTGRTYGVYARAVSPFGFGVYGEQGTLNGIPTPPAGVFGGSADGIGVFGLTDAVDEAGIYGLATSSATGGIGVKGRSNAADGYAGYFLGRSYFSTDVGIGTDSPFFKLDVAFSGRNGVRVVGNGAGDAFFSIHNGGPSAHYLFDNSSDAHAFTLESGTGTDVVFNSDGRNERMRITADGNVGIGTSEPTSRLTAVLPGAEFGRAAIRGVQGVGVGVTPTHGAAIWGESDVSFGVFGSTNATVDTLCGVVGEANNAAGAAIGVRGESFSTNGAGVKGVASNPSGANYGVFGEALSPSGYAGYFSGRGYFSGNIGIGDTTPAASLTVGDLDKFQVSGTDGDVTFTDDQASVTFPASAAPNAPMIHMYASGVENANRMVLAHSPTFSNWGLQFQDTAGNAFHFLRSGTSILTVDLENSGVGINTNNASGFALAVNGMAAKPGGGSWSSLSDRRLKKNIQPLQGALARLLSLRGVTFECTEEGLQTGLAAPGRHMGLIAQEVEEVLPEWVDASPGGYKYVTERGMTALTVEAVKDQQRQIDALRTENANLKARLETIEALLPKPPASRDHR